MFAVSEESKFQGHVYYGTRSKCVHGTGAATSFTGYTHKVEYYY